MQFFRRSAEIKRRHVMGWLMVMWLLSVTGVGAAFAQSPLMAPPLPLWGPGRIQSPTILSQLPTMHDREQDIIRQTPTLSGRLQVSEQTLIPYVGAGFGGGFVTERDRALGPASVFPQQNLLGDSLGKGMMPNEFHMGIRIPF